MADVELVIKIPEELYQMCRSCLGDADCIESAIANGIPLPKGHGRLIDADALNEAYTYECISECDCCEHCSKDGHGCELLLNAPTILEAKEQSE